MKVGFPPAPVAPRAVLLRRMDQAAQRQCVLLCAPFGMGKSALLEQWLSAQEGNVIRLDAARLAVARMAESASWDAALAGAGHSDGRIYVLLDPLPCPIGQELVARLALLIRSLPPDVYMLMAMEPPCPAIFGELFMEGRLSLLRAGELRLTEPDIANGMPMPEQRARLYFSGGNAAMYFHSDVIAGDFRLRPEIERILREKLSGLDIREWEGLPPPILLDWRMRGEELPSAALALHAHYIADARMARSLGEAALKEEMMDALLAVHVGAGCTDSGGKYAPPCLCMEELPMASPLLHRSFRDFGEANVDMWEGEAFRIAFGEAYTALRQIAAAGMRMERGDAHSAYALAVQANADLSLPPAYVLYTKALLAELACVMGDASAKRMAAGLSDAPYTYGEGYTMPLMREAASVRLLASLDDKAAAEKYIAQHPFGDVPDALTGLFSGIAALVSYVCLQMPYLAIPLGERLHAMAQARGRLYDSIEIALLTSCAYHQAGEPAESARYLVMAGEAASRGPYTHAFLLWRHLLPALLENARQNGGLGRTGAFFAHMRAELLLQGV